MKNIWLTTAVAVAAASAITAHAIPTITLDDGINGPISLQDNAVGDTVAALGIVNWQVENYGVWSLNINTGTTKPALGSETSPYLDLKFYALSSAAGSLTITFSEVGFSYVGGLLDGWGGTTFGTAVNSIAVNGQTVLTQGPFGPGAFSSTALFLADLSPDDLVSISVTITHDGAGLTTGDKELTTVPDGGMTVMLLGAALSGLGLIRRKVIA
jgi:hypothetical protein